MAEHDYQKIIAALSEEAIIGFVLEHGATERSRTEQHIWFTTICHGGDSHKLCYNRDTKTFYCYTRCGYMSVLQLIQNVLDCPFSQALRLAEKLSGMGNTLGLGVDTNVSEGHLRALQRVSKLRQRKTKEPVVLKSIPPTILEYFSHDTFYTGWRDEGIEASAMQDFGIAWDETDKAIIIPHYDIDGILIGIRRRGVSERTGGKYFPLCLAGTMYAHPLGLNLYGMHLHKQNIRSSKQAIVFEGEKSVLKHHTSHAPSNAVAVCGFNITKTQRDLLLRAGVEEVILAFDKDVDMSDTRSDEYRRYCDKVNSLGRLFTPYCRAYALVDEGNLLELHDSPIDKGREVFDCLMKNKVAIHS